MTVSILNHDCENGTLAVNVTVTEIDIDDEDDVCGSTVDKSSEQGEYIQGIFSP